MNNAPAYSQGVKTALAVLRLNKSAGIYSSLFTRPAAYLEGVGQSAEKALYGQTSKWLSPGAQNTLQAHLKGVPGKTLQEAALGAGMGAALGAPMQAAFADPDHRGEAAAQGALSGLGTGALWGGISGATRGLIHNATRNNLQNYAASRRFKNPAAKATQTFDSRSWWQNVKDTATGKGPLGRRGAATAALGGTAGLALGDIYLPSKVDSMLHPEPEAQPAPQQAPQRVVTAATRNDDGGMPIEAKGSSIGSIISNISTKTLLRTKRFPMQRKLHPFVLDIAPVLITAAGGTAGFMAAKKLDAHLNSRRHPSTSKKK